MEWFSELLFSDGTPHAILVLAFVIAVGLALARFTIKGVSIGSAWILFAGIFIGALGLTLDAHTLHFVREFGLVLFVFSIGLQVGPSFLSSLRHGGLTLNLLAAGVIVLGIACTVGVFFLSGLPAGTVVGVMSGAVTNTPGLGAAQQTFMEVTGQLDPSIAAGYAMAYPMAVVGIIASMIVLRRIGGVDVAKEADELQRAAGATAKAARRFSLSIANPAVFGKTLREVQELIPHEFVVSRVRHSSTQVVELVDLDTRFEPGDQLMVIAKRRDRNSLAAFFGPRVEVPDEQWQDGPELLESRQMVLSRTRLNGVALGQLSLRTLHGVNVTRVHRAGVDLVASSQLRLVLGDRLTVVGATADLVRAERLLGNSPRSLNAPNLFVLFVGIVLGVVVGSMPFAVPGVPAPVKLGLAGGPLIVALLLGRFGPRLHLITYSTASANLLLREIGMALFLAGIGLAAGPTFLATVVGGGYRWVLWGLLITLVPVLVVGLIGMKLAKVNYLTLIGVLAGATTDPPALAYAQSLSDSDAPTMGYAAVYPLTMFLRVIAAQVLVIVLV